MFNFEHDANTQTEVTHVFGKLLDRCPGALVHQGGRIASFWFRAWALIN
jgi:hypothetical protein